MAGRFFINDRRVRRNLYSFFICSQELTLPVVKGYLLPFSCGRFF